ncbi:unnamed protein product, partial [marine sediment metagenome]
HSPRVPGFGVAAFNLPCYECCGDFYDYFVIDDINTSFTISDAEGKGLPAALYAFQLKSYLQACFELTKNPLEVITRLNRFLSKVTERHLTFATLFLGILNHEECSFTYVSAGHSYPLLIKESGSPVFLREGNNPILGIDTNARYTEKGHIHLEKGDVLILYTDGITDAANEKGERLGEEGLITIAAKHRSLNAQDIIKTIAREVKNYSGTKRQFDDITLIVIKRYD